MKFTNEQLEGILPEIDALLKSKDVAIPYRQLAAICEFSKRYQISLPVSKPNPRYTHKLDKLWPITEFITDWYKKRYGERLKINPGPGYCVFLIKDDPWVFKYPLAVGNWRYGAWKENDNDKPDLSRGESILNVVDSIENFPSAARERLTPSELKYLFEIFGLGLKALTKIKYCKKNELIESAKSDIDVAVTHLMSSKPECGLSKWSSLQATEKIIKAAIKNRGIPFKKIHILSDLIKQLDVGLHVEKLNSEIAKVQCTPGVRYGDEVVRLNEAVEAHHATFRIILLLKLSPDPIKEIIKPLKTFTQKINELSQSDFIKQWEHTNISFNMSFTKNNRNGYDLEINESKYEYKYIVEIISIFQDIIHPDQISSFDNLSKIYNETDYKHGLSYKYGEYRNEFSTLMSTRLPIKPKESDRYLSLRDILYTFVYGSKNIGNPSLIKTYRRWMSSPASKAIYNHHFQVLAKEVIDIFIKVAELNKKVIDLCENK